MDLRASRIAVLDINHGGLLLAEELRALGYDTLAVDVYGTRKPPEAMVKIVRPEDVDGCDALVAPVHMPPNRLMEEASKRNVPVYTHHRIAGMIVGETGRLSGMRSVEVTGTYGKTTACFIIARMLAAAGERVLLHTSSGLYYEGRPLGKRLSVTPANVIAALDAAREAGARPTSCVLEVSLGGCGTADVGVITTLDRAYPIAGGTSSSSTAKMQMIEYARRGSVIVHDATYSVLSPEREVTFGPGGDVHYDQNGLIKSPLFPSTCICPPVSGGLDQATYGQPTLCATATALSLGVCPETIAASMEAFEGVPGRMKYETLEGRTLLDNSNSGLTVHGIRRALAQGEAHPGRRVLVVGEERHNVCDGLDPEMALRISESAGVDAVVLVGGRLAAAGAKYAWAPALQDGIRAALAVTAPGDLIISCVKTWR